MFNVLRIFFSLLLIFSFSSSYAGSAKRLLRKSRGIASVKRNYRFRVSDREWRRMTPGQQLEYLQIIQDLAITLSVEKKNGFSSIQQSPSHWLDLIFPKAEADSFALGIRNPNDSNDRFDTRRMFTDGRQIIDENKCSGGKKPCGTYMGLDSNGKVFCVASTVTASCPVTDDGIRNLHSRLSGCRAKSPSARDRYCKSLITNYDNHLKGKEQYCRIKNGGWCVAADKAIAGLRAIDPQAPAAQKGLGRDAQSCERAAAEIRSRGRNRFHDQSSSAVKDRITRQINEVEKKMADIMGQLASATGAQKDSLESQLAGLRQRRNQLGVEAVREGMVDDARPRAGRTNTKWNRILNAVHYACPQHTRGNGVTFRDIERTFGTCRLPETDFPLSSADEQALARLRESGPTNTNDNYVDAVVQAIGVTPEQFGQIFCDTPSIKNDSKASAKFSSNYSAHADYRTLKNEYGWGGANRDSGIQLYKCLRDATGHMRDNEYVPSPKRGLQAHASRDQCNSFTVSKPLEELGQASADSPFLFWDKNTRRCHIIKGKPRAAATGTGANSFTGNFGKIHIPTEYYDSRTSRWIQAKGDQRLILSTDEIEKAASSDHIRGYMCTFNERAVRSQPLAAPNSTPTWDFDGVSI